MNNNILSKEEVLKITNKYYISYYCEDDVCVLSDYNYYNKYIYFPDNNGDIIKYNVNICAKKTIGNCIANYTKDIECFSNKCYNNYCIQ